VYLIYFDENKFSVEDPFFYIGGILIESEKVQSLDKTLMQIQYNYFGTSVLLKETELHGKDIFHGKGNFKKMKLAERIKLIVDIANFIMNNKIPIRMICIDVNKHRQRYLYPEPEYRLGLMLFLERICDFLDEKDKLGLVFGDYEKDEITKSILDFSQFKVDGKTKMYFGRPLGRLIDTIYFTQSHHSRFLQISDIMVFLANRYDIEPNQIDKWHENEARAAWEKIKNGTDSKFSDGHKKGTTSLKRVSSLLERTSAGRLQFYV